MSHWKSIARALLFAILPVVFIAGAPAAAGAENSPVHAYCGEETRAGRSVMGPAVGCDRGAGIVSGDAVAESRSRGTKLLSAIQLDERGR